MNRLSYHRFIAIRHTLPSDEWIRRMILHICIRLLLETTLVVWFGDFGRTPKVNPSAGRDHWASAGVACMGGGGIKRGLTYGATDELGYNAVENIVHVHDLHATILHLLGLDHLRLTIKFQGLDIRLTNVSGNVVTDLLA